MSIVDERGRLFGRFNLVDAAAGVFVLVLLPVGYAAYAVFRVPAPSLTSVEPASFEVAETPHVRIRGTNLLPYLSVYVSPAGQPLPRYLNNRAQTEAEFRIASPNAAEIELPTLEPGSYDLYLFNEANELARLPNAFTVTPKAGPVQKAPADRTVARVRIRIVVPADVAAFPAVRDVDSHGSPTESGEPDATLLAIRRVNLPNTTPGVNDYVLMYLDLRVPVSLLADRNLWFYKGQPIRVGASVEFGTERYITQGLIVLADIPLGVPWGEQQDGRKP